MLILFELSFALLFTVPLFWTQTGHGLKPPPVLASDRTHEQNLDALRRHLKRTIPKYGPHVIRSFHQHLLSQLSQYFCQMIVNLAEQYGKEGAISQAYREYVKEVALQDVQ